MFRILWFLVFIFFVVAGLVWLFERPGSAVLDWQGYRLETSFAVLAGAAGFLAVFAALLYRGWIALIRAPARVGEVWHQRRRTKGYKALTRGMVAVAAGDAAEAGRQVKRAEALMNEAPLSLLLSAQSAQLNGDDQAAMRFFQEMTENPETEFLGIRGLLAHAMKSGDEVRALGLARRAHRLQSKSEWVSTSLFELQIRAGQWVDAQITIDEQLRLGFTSRDDHKQQKAVLTVQQGLELDISDKADEADQKFKTAYDTAPGFIPAVIHHVEALIAQDKYGRAIDILVKTWKSKPHPELVGLYWRATKAENPLQRVKAIDTLILGNKEHLESQIVLARTNLEARLWGEARKYLSAIVDTGKSRDEARVCRLWADLEESEHGDVEAIQAWLKRAASADADPAWICDSCGNAIGGWSGVCGNCNGFDTFHWARARHVLGEERKESKVYSETGGLRQLSVKT